MRRGFSLVEVMVALCILMICAACLFRLNVVAVRARSHGEILTRATLLGAMKAEELANPRAAPGAIQPGWHRDPGNPIKDGGMDFYRFWAVKEDTQGASASVYVIWSEKNRAKAADFSSLQEVEASSCPIVAIDEYIPLPR